MKKCKLRRERFTFTSAVVLITIDLTGCVKLAVVMQRSGKLLSLIKGREEKCDMGCPDNCAFRELLEEVAGLTQVSDMLDLGSHTFNEGCNHMRWFAMVTPDISTLSVRDTNELEYVTWVPLRDVLDPMYSANRYVANRSFWRLHYDSELVYELEQLAHDEFTAHGWW